MCAHKLLKSKTEVSRRKRRGQLGFTLVETMISLTILSIVLGFGTQFYMRTQKIVNLSESEAKMQMYSRLAMANITRELRQASDYYEIPFLNVPQAKEILFVRPKDDASVGQVASYVLVRYWFHEHSNGVFSLLRAEKAHGSDARFVSGDSSFAPDANNQNDVRTYRISALVREATVLEPGKQSFFLQDKSRPGVIGIRLVTATYGYKHTGVVGNRNQEVKRQFRIDTSINARNLQL